MDRAYNSLRLAFVGIVGSVAFTHFIHTAYLNPNRYGAYEQTTIALASGTFVLLCDVFLKGIIKPQPNLSEEQFKAAEKVALTRRHVLIYLIFVSASTIFSAACLTLGWGVPETVQQQRVIWLVLLSPSLGVIMWSCLALLSPHSNYIPTFVILLTSSPFIIFSDPNAVYQVFGTAFVSITILAAAILINQVCLLEWDSVQLAPVPELESGLLYIAKKVKVSPPPPIKLTQAFSRGLFQAVFIYTAVFYPTSTSFVIENVSLWAVGAIIGTVFCQYFIKIQLPYIGASLCCLGGWYANLGGADNMLTTAPIAFLLGVTTSPAMDNKVHTTLISLMTLALLATVFGSLPSELIFMMAVTGVAFLSELSSHFFAV